MNLANGVSETYKELSRLMYAVRRNCRHLALLGASVVNPRHPFPTDHLELMAAFRGNGIGSVAAAGDASTGWPVVPRLVLVLLRSARCLLTAVRDMLRLAYVKARLAPMIRKTKREPAAVVMKTWWFGLDTLNSSADFYYGTLPHVLEQRGVNCLLLCGDAVGGNAERFARAVLSRTTVRSVPESVLVPLWAPLVTAVHQVVTSVKLRRLARTTTDERLSRLYAHASIDCLEPATTRNNLYFYVARTVVKTWRPRAFVTLYEGQPWEKPAWQGAKAGDRGCLVVGYQHTVVMPHSFSLIQPNIGSWELAAPDVVLCLGETTRTMMTPGHAPHGTTLVEFGTFRRRAGEAEQAPRPGLRTILVVPEGVTREAKLLFDFATRTARLLPGYHFVFRCHPIMPFVRVRPHLEDPPEECPNIEVSDQEAIGDDFGRSSVLLYRGSSSVLYAVLHGLKPIYVHDDDHPDVDPLFELETWRESVSSPAELAELLAQYGSATAEGSAEEWRRAADYVRAYTAPVSDEAIDRFLAAVGLPTGMVSA